MKELDKLFRQYTGDGIRYWMNRIGVLIAKSGKEIKGYKGLKTECPSRWVSELAGEILPKVYKNTPVESDENLTATRILSLLFTLWFYRLGRAKAYDPRRPVKARKEAMSRLNEYAGMLLTCLNDESLDGEFFPDQEWQSPFVSGAMYKPDVAELERQRFSKDQKKKGKK